MIESAEHELAKVEEKTEAAIHSIGSLSEESKS
jgi:hypothetical protein